MFEDKPPPPKTGRKKQAKIVPQMTLPKANPLNVQMAKGELNGDIEHDDKKEVGAVKNLLKTLDHEANRLMANGYWTALVFIDEGTCQEFMRQAGWLEHSVGLGAYVDGMAVVAMLNELRGKCGMPLIKLAPTPLPFKSKRQDKRLVAEVGVFQPAPEPEPTTPDEDDKAKSKRKTKRQG